MSPFKDLKEILEVPRIYEEENWHSPGGRAIRDIVFCVNDGIVSTIGFLVGIAGAFASRRMCFVAGLAEVLAGSVSMFFGGYLSTKSQQEFFVDYFNWLNNCSYCLSCNIFSQGL